MRKFTILLTLAFALAQAQAAQVIDLNGHYKLMIEQVADAPSPTPVPTATPTPKPSPTPVSTPTPTPVTPQQSGSIPAGASVSQQWMTHLDGYWHSSRLGNSSAIDDQKCYLQIAVAQPLQHKAVLDFWIRTNVDFETSNLNIKSPVRAWGDSNDYIGHTLGSGAMQWTCEGANSGNFNGTYGYFDYIRTPDAWQHIVATWNFDNKTFTMTMNGVSAHGGFSGVNFAGFRYQYDMQLVVANPNSSACLPKGSYFDVRDDYSLTGN